MDAYQRNKSDAILTIHFIVDIDLALMHEWAFYLEMYEGMNVAN